MRGELGFELDDADARVSWSAIVDTIAHITEPCLQRWRVVFLDGGRVGDDGRGTGNGSPGAADGVQEGHVGFLGVHGEVHGLAREEICVEDEVDAAVLLQYISDWF